MKRSDDDRFRPRLGPPKARGAGGQRFVSRVIRVATQAGPINPRTLARDREGSVPAAGRGHVASRFAERGLSPRSRRVVIKTRLVILKAAGPRSTETHLRYIQRDGVTRDGTPARVYDATSDAADVKSFEARGRGDRHQFRLIVAPEDTDALGDLQGFTRHLMARMEGDLGTRLDWIAVDHWDTDNPHSHVVLRGKDHTGADLVIARDYIRHGMRQRASALATEWLGPRTQREIESAMSREVAQERWTSLDRELVGGAREGIVDLSRPSDKLSAARRLLLIGRADRLVQFGLAERKAYLTWVLRPDAEAVLRTMGERGDIVRTMQRALNGQVRELAVISPTDPGPHWPLRPIVGCVIAKGLHDELHDAGYLVIDGIESKAHYVALPPVVDLGAIPIGAVVEVGAPSTARPVDRAVAAMSTDGIYRTDRDLAALQARGRSASEAHRVVEGRVRRLEALRRAGVVQRVGAAIWRVPTDFEERGLIHDWQRDGPTPVRVLSDWPVDRQVRAIGATWLDQQLLSGARPAAGGFGSEVRDALDERETFLVEHGLAARRGARLVFARNLLATLRQRELSAAAGALAAETGLTYRPALAGATVAGVYRRSIPLASGRFAMIDDGPGFTLVPWRAVLDPHLGRRVRGVLHGTGVSWDFSSRLELLR